MLITTTVGMTSQMVKDAITAYLICEGLVVLADDEMKIEVHEDNSLTVTIISGE